MNVEIHAPSTPAAVISLVIAVLALLGYFIAPETPAGFLIAMLAYVVLALGSMVRF